MKAGGLESVILLKKHLGQYHGTVPESDLILLMCSNGTFSEWGLWTEKAYRQTLQTAHNSKWWKEKEKKVWKKKLNDIWNFGLIMNAFSVPKSVVSFAEALRGDSAHQVNALIQRRTLSHESARAKFGMHAPSLPYGFGAIKRNACPCGHLCHAGCGQTQIRVCIGGGWHTVIISRWWNWPSINPGDQEDWG